MIDGDTVRGQHDEVVRSPVEETLNHVPEVKSNELCRAKRFERSVDD
jgi:putative transposase